jgi:hypothetical protein
MSPKKSRTPPSLDIGEASRLASRAEAEAIFLIGHKSGRGNENKKRKRKNFKRFS